MPLHKTLDERRRGAAVNELFRGRVTDVRSGRPDECGRLSVKSWNDTEKTLAVGSRNLGSSPRDARLSFVGKRYLAKWATGHKGVATLAREP